MQTIAITARIPDKLLQETKAVFPRSSQTKSLINALENGVAAAKQQQAKMVQDYQTIQPESYTFVTEGNQIAHEVWQSEDIYLQLLK